MSEVIFAEGLTKSYSGSKKYRRQGIAANK